MTYIEVHDCLQLCLSSTWAVSDAHVLQSDSTGEIAWTDRDSRESEVGTPT